MQPASARGTGIQVIHEWNQLPRKKPLVCISFLFLFFFYLLIKFDLNVF